MSRLLSNSDSLVVLEELLVHVYALIYLALIQQLTLSQVKIL